MQDLDKKILAVFFTRNISLKKWQEIGSLERELSLYVKLKENFSAIKFFTYGDANDGDCLEEYKKYFQVYPKKWKIPGTIYSFLLPWFYRHELKQVDIYKTNQMDGAWAAAIAKLLYRKKLVVRCGYEWLYTARQNKKNIFLIFAIWLLEKFCYQLADQVVVTTAAMKNFIISNFKLPFDKMAVIPNFIDTDLFKPLNTGSRDKKVISYVGRLEPEKNLFNLIQGLAELDIELNIYGSGSLRAELENFSRSCSKLKVFFHGNVGNSELPTELNKGEMYIQMSRYEGNPKTILEAMSCGLAVIASDVSGIREIIQHKENGYLCGLDAESIKLAAETVLHDDVLRQKIGLNARTTIVRTCSLDQIMAREMDIYKNI